VKHVSPEKEARWFKKPGLQSSSEQCLTYGKGMRQLFNLLSFRTVYPEAQYPYANASNDRTNALAIPTLNTRTPCMLDP
jgi:hypothetical protein